MARSLDELVTSVAAQLMSADSRTAADVSGRVLADLGHHFDVDACFLRHNDPVVRATKLVAEYPIRQDVPDPDPLGVVYFESADPIFAMLEYAKEPIIIRPDPVNDEYGRRIEQAQGVPVVSLAAVPLVSGDVTTGAIGFIKFDDREWTTPELNALAAIASLFAQLQARTLAEDGLRYLAEHDDLTGLRNRRALIAYLGRRLADGQLGSVPVLLLNVDRLKILNDHLGHQFGDRFLQVFAERLRVFAGESFVLARLGSDEFVIVPNEPMNDDEAVAWAGSLLSVVGNSVDVSGGVERVRRSASIGIASGVPGHDSAFDVLKRAGEALLEAKSAGGDVVRTFTKEMSIQSEMHNDIELHLRDAIINDELVLHYLPEVDLRTGEILAVEALVRWNHPTRGLLYPDSFINVAEQINLSGELGRWVLRNACSNFARWRALGIGRNVLLRVNTSPAQLVSVNFPDEVEKVVDEFQIQPGELSLEITETVVVRDIDRTTATLEVLRDIGVTAAIDDFGTGHNVLSHLKTLPIDTVKIDKSFVFDLGTSSRDHAIVRSIVELANAFGLEVVAEGVETEAAVVELLRYGCYRAQGFLLSRPLPGGDLEALLRRGRVPRDAANVS